MHASITGQRLSSHAPAHHGGGCASQCQAAHRKAEEIFDRLREKYPYANISTVYRTLELLKELGLAAEISIGDGIVRYHAKENSRHHHLVCTGCGKMFDLSEDELVPLEQSLIKNHGFKPDIHHLAIFGLCSVCQK